MRIHFPADHFFPPHGFGFDPGNFQNSEVASLGQSETVQYVAYDDTGRLTTYTNAAGVQTTYSWSGANMASVNDPRYLAGETSRPKVTNTYSGNRVASQTYSDGTGYQFVYAYDDKGRVASTEVTNGRGIKEKLEYDYRDGEDEDGGCHISVGGTGAGGGGAGKSGAVFVRTRSGGVPGLRPSIWE